MMSALFAARVLYFYGYIAWPVTGTRREIATPTLTKTVIKSSSTHCFNNVWLSGVSSHRRHKCGNTGVHTTGLVALTQITGYTIDIKVLTRNYGIWVNSCIASRPAGRPIAANFSTPTLTFRHNTQAQRPLRRSLCLPLTSFFNLKFIVGSSTENSFLA